MFRRAQAVRDVVKGRRLRTVSNTLHFTYSALSKWVHRFAIERGPKGSAIDPDLVAAPKWPVRSRKRLDRLVDQDPLQHGSLHSRWSGRETRARSLAHQTSVR